MKSLKRRFQKFVGDENGMEFIQVAVIVLAVVAIAAIIWLMYDAVKQGVQDAADAVPDAFSGG